MAFPADWPRRWWLLPGETAAYIDVAGRPTLSLVYEYDDGNLWGFRLDSMQPIYDHHADAFVHGLDRRSDSDQSLVDAVYAAARRLRGGREDWKLTGRQQLAINIAAKELPKAPWVSGKKLRAELMKELGVSDLDEAKSLTKSLEPRWLAEVEGDRFCLTLPGLMTSREGGRATKVLRSVLTVFDVKYNGVADQEGDPDFDRFRLDDIMRCGELEVADRDFALNAVLILRLGIVDPVLDNTNAALYVGNPGWRPPADIERLAACRGNIQAFWAATRQGKEVHRPWSTAPLRLKETINETERRQRVGHPLRPPTRGFGQGSVSPPTDPMLWSAGKMEPGSNDNLEEQMRLVAFITQRAMQATTKAQPVSAGREETMQKYDVALSFAGAERSYAEELAAKVKAAGFAVFYDNDEAADLWGKDLVVHLADVYSKNSRYCVMFLSKTYKEREWTNHERQAAQERALKERGAEYILPVKIDDTEIPGIRSTTGYLPIALGIDKIAELLITKLRSST